MHIQGLRVLGSLSVLGLAATFFISALWVLIEVLFRSICWPGHPVSRALPALSPSPITLNAPVMGLKDGLTAALPAFRRMSWCSCFFPLLPSVLHSFEEEDHIKNCPTTFSQKDSSGLCRLWVQLQSLVQLAAASMMGCLIEIWSHAEAPEEGAMGTATTLRLLPRGLV